MLAKALVHAGGAIGVLCEPDVDRRRFEGGRHAVELSFVPRRRKRVPGFDVETTAGGEHCRRTVLRVGHLLVDIGLAEGDERAARGIGAILVAHAREKLVEKTVCFEPRRLELRGRFELADGGLHVLGRGQELGQRDTREGVFGCQLDETAKSEERRRGIVKSVALDLREAPEDAAPFGARVRPDQAIELPLVGRGDASEVLGAQELVFDGRERTRHLRIVFDGRLVERDSAGNVSRSPAAEARRFDERARSLLAAARPFGQLHGHSHRFVPSSARLVHGPQPLEKRSLAGIELERAPNGVVRCGETLRRNHRQRFGALDVGREARHETVVQRRRLGVFSAIEGNGRAPAQCADVRRHHRERTLEPLDRLLDPSFGARDVAERNEHERPARARLVGEPLVGGQVTGLRPRRVPRCHRLVRDRHPSLDFSILLLLRLFRGVIEPEGLRRGRVEEAVTLRGDHQHVAGMLVGVDVERAR